MKHSARWMMLGRAIRGIRSQISSGVTPSGSASGDLIGTYPGPSLAAQFGRWTKYTVTHTQFQSAGFTNDIEIFQLPSGGNIHAVKLKHSVAFGGGLIAAYSLSVGTSGNLVKYLPASNVFTSPSNTGIASLGFFGCEAHGQSISIRVAAVSTTGLLSTSTQGSADIWVLTSTVL